DDRARSALCHSATKSRSAQPQFIGKNEQERRFRVDGYGVMVTVYFQGDLLHETAIATSALMHRKFSSTCQARIGLTDLQGRAWMTIAVPDASSQDRPFRGWLIAAGRLKQVLQYRLSFTTRS